MSKTVLIASPQHLFASAVASVLRAAGFDVIATVTDPVAALEQAARHDPAICVIDAEISGGAVGPIRDLVRQRPGAAVLVLAAASPLDLVAYVRAGAAGVVAKTSSGPGMVRAVEAVLAGGLALPRGSVAALIQDFRGGRQRVGFEGRLLSLTPREADVLQLVNGGLTTREIARDLDLSPVTVRRHRGSLAAKARAATG